jgi:crotonobetainyl-CoA:carnitine CoA-transferase CaiB-like acyl-CoA transferase
MSGLMSVTGQVGGTPTRLGIPIADIGAGMFTAYAIVAALFQRERTGEGQYIDVSMLGGQIALMTYQAGIYFMTGRVPGPMGNAHPMIVPYDTFPTADGFINIAVGNDGLWQRFCAALDLDDAAKNERFLTNAGRIAHKELVYEIAIGTLSKLPTEEVVRRLDAQGVPCGPINNVEQIFADPQTLDQGLMRDVAHPKLGTVTLTGFPYHFSGSELEIRQPPPLLGQHTEEILAEVGYAGEEIAEMIGCGAATKTT